MENFVYCLVDEKEKLRFSCGSSRKTKYFATESRAKNAVNIHNEYYKKEPKWRVAKYKLVEVPIDEVIE